MKTKRFFYFLLPFICLVTSLQAKDLSPQEFVTKYLKNVLKTADTFSSPKLAVDDTNFYIYDFKECKINIYSRKNGQKTASFGSKGSGVGQFEYIDAVSPSKDTLFVSSRKKMSAFSLNGNPIKELLSKDPLSVYFPIENGFISERSEYSPTDKNKNVMAYYLLDKELNRIKVILKNEYKQEPTGNNKKDPWLLYRPCRKGIVYDNKLFVGSSDQGFVFQVFDQQGKKLYDIKRDEPKIKFTDEYKNLVFKKIKALVGGDAGFKSLQETRDLITPGYIPAYFNFFVDDDKIWAFKFASINEPDKIEILILDLKGKLIASCKPPLGELSFLLEEKSMSFIYKGKLYILFSTPGKGTIINEVDLFSFLNNK